MKLHKKLIILQLFIGLLYSSESVKASNTSKLEQNFDFLSELESIRQTAVAKAQAEALVKIPDHIKGTTSNFPGSEEKEYEVSFEEAHARLFEAALNPKTYNILSIDGGGMRGLIPALMCAYIERQTKHQIYEMFDYGAGTSIGGILTLGYFSPVAEFNNKPRPASEFVKLFKERGNEIFPRESKSSIPIRLKDYLYNYTLKAVHDIGWSAYSSSPLELLLKEYFGEATSLKSLLKPVAITSVEAVSQNPMIFSNFEEAHEKLKLWQVGLATSAAPTYFPAYSWPGETKKRYVDGGLYRNNPASDGFALANEHADEFIYQGNLFTLSLGTGQVPPENIISSNAGKREVRAIIDTLMTASSVGVDSIFSKIYKKLPSNYRRVNPFLGRNMNLDSSSKKDLDTLEEAAQSCYSHIDDILDGPLRNTLEKLD